MKEYDAPLLARLEKAAQVLAQGGHDNLARDVRDAGDILATRRNVSQQREREEAAERSEAAELLGSR